MSTPLTKAFYQKPTLELAPALLGCELVSYVDGEEVGGIIVEVEAYRGDIDQACHCYHKRTKRNDVMFWEPGYAYIYFIYGMYHCLNVVSEKRDFGAAVLIRAIEPTRGIEVMRERRGGKRDRDLANGPGKLCQALGLDTSYSGQHFNTADDFALLKGRRIDKANIERSSRIGISKSTELDWRFSMKDNPWVSR